MATLTLKTDAPGKAGKRPVFGFGSRTIGMAVFEFAFDGTYASGGEDISGIWDYFKEVIGIMPASGETTIADQRYYSVDYTNKKLILYTAGATEAAGDQSAVTGVRLLVWGYI